MYPSLSRAPEIAAFMADDPGLWAADIDGGVAVIVSRFGPLTEREAEDAFDLLGQMKTARLACPKNEVQRLIEWTRLVHGSKTAAHMLLKYAGTAREGAGVTSGAGKAGVDSYRNAA